MGAGRCGLAWRAMWRCVGNRRAAASLNAGGGGGTVGGEESEVVRGPYGMGGVDGVGGPGAQCTGREGGVAAVGRTPLTCGPVACMPESKRAPFHLSEADRPSTLPCRCR